MGKSLKHTAFTFILSLLLLSTSLAQNTSQIELVSAEELTGVEKNGTKAQKITGDAIFKHQGALMYCDSAFLFQTDNSLEAYGNIRINQGDTLNLFGDALDYKGDERVAVVTGDTVKLENNDFILTTNRLVYNRFTNVAQYSTGALIESKNDSNILISDIGYFYSNQSLFFFKDSVVLTNPNFIMRSDTLKYYSSTELVNFLGPTTIEGDSNLIYCETGWYDTPKDQSTYYDNAYLISDGRKLEGDTLYYDRLLGYGQADGNVQITDTTENVMINGEHAEVYELNDSALVVGNPLLTQTFEADSLFMHADTFKVFKDKAGNRSMMAYYGVKIYKSDLQGRCDSMVYNLSDSTIEMHREPILWSEQNQMTAEQIDLRTANNKIHSIYMNADAFIISEVDSIKYNQIKGKEMTGFFKNGKLETLKVRGNGQTTYYGKDEQEKFIGVNVAESSDIDIRLGEDGIEGLSFINQPNATMHPMGELDPVTELRYKGFKWLIELRPTEKADIFK